MKRNDIADYMNEVLADVVQSFYDERGRGARYRLTLVGIDYLKILLEKDFNNLNNIEEIMSLVTKFIKDKHLVEDVSWQLNEEVAQYVTMKVSGCLHRKLCEKLVSRDIEILVCPIANFVMYLMENALNMTSEFASAELGDLHCSSKIVFFNPKLS
ncbi:MAG: hypothetical protein K6U04_11720 [Armatimonadetes bacterium]|nr:hypothetical protein [Armatimonadota bacterium]